MKLKAILLSFSFFVFLAGISQTTHTVVNVGITFDPPTLTIQEGDQVEWNIAGQHNVIETDEESYNDELGIPLPDGFSLPSGGGLVTTEQLAVGTHYYHCQPHFGLGMKGIVIVEAAEGCPGDFNGDQLRNIDDFISFNSLFGTDCLNCPEDINDDGLINIDDFIAFNSVFGVPCD